MGQFIDRTGMIYGELTVLRRDLKDGPASKGVRVKWLCSCSCGESTIVTGHELSSGDTTSCGHLKKELLSVRARTHGLSRSPTYNTWQAMKDRCLNPNHGHFELYGGRGIAVCEWWESSFENFLEDMGEKPDGMSIDRINVDGDYTKENCRWATAQEQADNKRTNVMWMGKLRTIKEIAAMVGVPRTSLNKLLKRGMTAEKAVAWATQKRKPTPIERL